VEVFDLENHPKASRVRGRVRQASQTIRDSTIPPAIAPLRVVQVVIIGMSEELETNVES
jgi:hypothetical protein